MPLILTSRLSKVACPSPVMAGLDPAIHVFAAVEDVDARHGAGHDEGGFEVEATRRG